MPSKSKDTNSSSTPSTVPTSPKDNTDVDEGMETSPEDGKPEPSNDSEMVEESKSETSFSNPLLEHLFTKCHLIERILDAWEDNDSGENKTGYQRKGYMGQLTRIANIIVEKQEKDDSRKEFIVNQINKLTDETRERWEAFVSGKLTETNTKNLIEPTSTYTNAMSNSEDDDADFRDLAFPQESALQQMYSDYQMQQMSEHFIDSFGFGAEEINEDESSSSAKRFTTINFGLDEDDFDKNEDRDALFENVCNAKNRGDDELQENDDDMWSDKTKEIDFGMNDVKTGDQNSSDEEDAEDEAKKKKMEVEDEEWTKMNSDSNAVSQVAMDTGNPWEEGQQTSKSTTAAQAIPFDEDSNLSAPIEQVRSSTPPDGGWANFGEFNDDSKDGMETAPIQTPETPSSTT